MQTYWTRFGLPTSIGVAFCCVAILAITTFKNTAALRDGEREVSRSHAIGEATHRNLSALKDMQTGERGYLITGRDIFLEPFRLGKTELQASWDELEELASSDDGLHRDVSQLKSLVNQKVAYLESAIALRASHSTDRISDDVIEIVRSESGERLMESVREMADKILKDQAQRLRSNELRSRELSSVSYRAIVLGNLIALAVITTSGVISYVDRYRRDATESILAAKESELSAIVNSTSDAILTFDENLQTRLMNPSASNLLGFPKLNPIHRSLFDLLIVDDETRRTLQNFLKSQQMDCRFCGFGKRQDGSQFPIEGKFARIESAGKRYNVLLFQDLTEIQKAESSRRELAAILDQVSDAIVVCDMEGKVVSWNRGAKVLHGVPAERAIGQSARELLCDASPQTWDDGTQQVANRHTYSTVFEMAAPDKQKLWIEHRRSLIRDARGEPIGQLIMHIDITERRMEEARQRRSQRLESIGTLAGGVAHDLNNILTPILMNAKLAQRPGVNQSRLLEMIVTSAERGGKMIRNLLAFAGGERAALELVYVDEVVREVEEILSHSLPKTIELKTNFAANLSQVMADPTELSQVLVNLAINARDAMPEGGELAIEAFNLNINASADQPLAAPGQGDYVVLRVTDQGHGIAPEIQERIFDPFFTTKTQGKGTGLGLATSLGIVRSYGGEIVVASEVGVGATFSVYLPAAETTFAVGSRSSRTVSDPDGNGELILLVDDEPNILESARALLLQSGYQVEVALSGHEAITRFSKSPEEFKLVIVDIMMPELDGVATKERLRALRRSIKIIGSSGLRRPRVDAGLEGFDGFLPKPYSNLEILRIVRRTLDAAT